MISSSKHFQTSPQTDFSTCTTISNTNTYNIDKETSAVNNSIPDGDTCGEYVMWMMGQVGLVIKMCHRGESSPLPGAVSTVTTLVLSGGCIRM